MLRGNTAEVKGVPNNMQSVSNNPRQLVSNNLITNGNPVDALPKQFIASMKTLFDILDDKQTGFVRYSDIEKGWQDDGCKGLPRGVLDSLRKVTPASGLLSFERFCAGLKLCLLRNQVESINATTTTNTNNVGNVLHCNKAKSARGNKSPRPPSAPLLNIESTLHNTVNAPWSNNNNPTATVRPRNHCMTAQRTLSLPQLSPDSSELEAEMTTVNIDAYNSPPPPPKPPRAAAVAAANSASLNQTGIRNALQNWQMGHLLSEMDASEKREKALPDYFTNRGSADGGSSSATDSAICAPAFLTPSKKSCSTLGNGSIGKRREPRRHTLQNGIDYNMLRRLKQYEEERELLLLGLDAIEKTRNWYLQQIDNVQDKMRCFERIGEHEDHWSEVQQERLNFQRARVLEVNRSLAALADSWERGGFPLHFNLAINQTHKSSNQLNNESDHSIFMVQSNEHRRQSKHFLTNEVQVKRLERENQALLRELYDMRLSGRRSMPLRVSQSQSSPVCSTSSGGGLIDADIVY